MKKRRKQKSTDTQKFKQTEKHIRFLSSVVEQSADGVAIADMEGNLLFVNNKWVKMHGYENEDELLGQNLSIFHNEEQFKSDLQPFNLQVKKHGNHTGEVGHMRRDGTIFPTQMTTTLLRDEKNDIVAIAGVVTDITERKQAEKTIREQLLYSNALNKIARLVNSEDNPEVIFEATTAILGETLKTDRALIYNVDFNKGKLIGLSEWLNMEEQEISPTLDTYDISVFGDGLNWLWENRTQIESHVDQVAPPLNKDGSGEILHNYMQIKSGLWVPVSFRDDGYYLLVFNQILYRRIWRKSEFDFLDSVTEQVNIALQKIKFLNALQNAKEKAEENDRLKSAFLANMSHEIRTPMNGIMGFANLLKEKTLSGEKQQLYINIIENSGKRMLSIINDLINISKIESGQMKVSLSETNINEQIEYLYMFFYPETEEKKLQLISSLPANESVIKTDREKIFAILTNLIKNSIKYTDKGIIKFGYTKKGSFLEFFVKDTGIGIAQNKKQIIFERFVQADLSLSSQYEGAGLGLSITKAYVEMLGGKIWIESEVGKGTQVYFTIPYEIRNYAKVTLKDASELIKVAQINNLNILIAEDEETSKTYLTIIIKSICKEIIYAKTGKEAVEHCRKNIDIDLILMDIKMPEMDGYEATRKIREFNKDVIIIAQTAYALTEDREKAIIAGCNDYITKPIKKDELMLIIAKHLSFLAAT